MAILFQDPKLEVPTVSTHTRPIYLACVREDPHRIWPNILKFPLNYRIIVHNYINPEVMRKMEWHRGKGEAIVTRPCLEMLQYVGHASGHAGAAELHTTRCKWWPSYFRCLMSGICHDPTNHDATQHNQKNHG